MSAKQPASVPIHDRCAAKVQTIFGQGSAFPITSTTYLTAWHVVDDAGVSRVTVAGRPVAEIVKLDGLDAALLIMEEPHGQEPWRVDVREIGPAEDIYTSGWGFGLHWWSRGLGTRDPSRLSVTVSPGDSGGAVLDAQGDVVGIIVAKDRRNAHHTYIVPIIDVMAVMPEGVLAEMTLVPTP